jgi:phosphoribosylamine---glycine ligase
LKILVVGSGGREHALAWRLGREGVEVIVAPGNGGTPQSAPVQATDIRGLVELAQREAVDLTIVGPEGPLADGLVDTFTGHGLPAFGPTRAAARLEWSKAWAKDFLQSHDIPTANAEVVHSEPGARRAIRRMGVPVVFKADGLAGGKGVFVALSDEDVEGALDQLFRHRSLGDAADQVLVEELLDGPELSVLAFTDGQRLAIMPPARDYKRLLDGDRGPNTGGMGGYTRPGYATPELLELIETRILRPTLAGMRAEGEPYRGVLYAGLMITPAGPKVLEFNSRFGDPECQLILPLLESSLVEVCASVAAGQLRPDEIRWSDAQTYGVVLASAGYPASVQVDAQIGGLETISEEVHVFHSGTRSEPEGALVTSGGRVLTVVGFDRAAVYSAAEGIEFAGKQFRRDIGLEVTSQPAAADA